MSDQDPNDTKEPPKRHPPYIPWATFLALLDRWQTGAPGKIDSSVLMHLPGGMHRQVKATLRFLGLIDVNDIATAKLEHLVQARANGGETWPLALKQAVVDVYRPVIGGLDLDKATPIQLNDVFKASGVEAGEVREKTIRFFLSAMKEAGLKYSAFLDKRGARTIGTRNGKAQRQRKPAVSSAVVRTDPGDDIDDEEQQVPEGFIAYPFRLRAEMSITVVLPADLTAADVTRLSRWLETLPLG